MRCLWRVIVVRAFAHERRGIEFERVPEVWIEMRVRAGAARVSRAKAGALGRKPAGISDERFLGVTNLSTHQAARALATHMLSLPAGAP